MLPGSVTLFEVYGFKVRVNISWAFIAILLAWSLAKGYFPSVYSGFSELTYWWMGIAGVIGLFASVLLHEFAHSVVAKAYGMEIKGITLWLLGGVAELGDEPPSPRVEFQMAIAGPAMSFVLALVFYVAALISTSAGTSRPITEVLSYLAVVNLVLAVFNLIPAFPMDGGRVLRAWLWHSKGSLRTATRISARAGQWFGFGLIIAGLASIAAGMGLNTLWWIILGMFIRFAADAALQQSQISSTLEGKSVLDFMTANPVCVPAHATAARFRDEWVLRHYHKVYPVKLADRLVGVISTRHLTAVDPQDLSRHTVKDLMDPLNESNRIEASASAEQALKRMQSSGNSRLIVTESGELAGIIALKDIIRVIRLQTEVGPIDDARPHLANQS